MLSFRFVSEFGVVFVVFSCFRCHFHSSQDRPIQRSRRRDQRRKNIHTYNNFRIKLSRFLFRFFFYLFDLSFRLRFFFLIFSFLFVSIYFFSVRPRPDCMCPPVSFVFFCPSPPISFHGIWRRSRLFQLIDLISFCFVVVFVSFFACVRFPLRVSSFRRSAHLRPAHLCPAPSTLRPLYAPPR